MPVLRMALMLPPPLRPWVASYSAGLHFEFLHHIRTWQWGVGQFGHVVIGGADAFDQIVIVVLALAVHLDADVCRVPAKRRRSSPSSSPRTASAVVESSAWPMAGRGWYANQSPDPWSPSRYRQPAPGPALQLFPAPPACATWLSMRVVSVTRTATLNKLGFLKPGG